MCLNQAFRLFSVDEPSLEPEAKKSKDTTPKATERRGSENETEEESEEEGEENDDLEVLPHDKDDVFFVPIDFQKITEEAEKQDEIIVLPRQKRCGSHTGSLIATTDLKKFHVAQKKEAHGKKKKTKSLFCRDRRGVDRTQAL